MKTRCWILDAGCWMLDTRCWILAAPAEARDGMSDRRVSGILAAPAEARSGLGGGSVSRMLNVRSRLQTKPQTSNSKLQTPNFLLLTSCFLLLTSFVNAQTDIPIGSWRLHLSYNSVQHLALSKQSVYASNQSGIIVQDRSDNSLTTYNTLNGLSDTGISALAYDNDNDLLLVGYENSNLDIIGNSTVVNFNRLKTSDVTGSKKINDITTHANLAYLSTDYGVVVFDLIKKELRETWRDLGSSGQSLKIFNADFLGDSVFIATEKGVMAGSLKDNLLDFKNWKRFDTGSFSLPVQFLVLFNNHIYAAINGQGIFRYDGGKWTKENFLQSVSFTSLSASAANLVVTDGKNVSLVDGNGKITITSSNLITSPVDALEDDRQILWIADQQNALVKGSGNSFENHFPNGPSGALASRLKYHNGTVYALAGGYSSSGTPLGNPGTVNQFNAGAWSSFSVVINDLTDIDFIGQDTYLASFGGGVEKIDGAGNTTVFNQNGIPFQGSGAVQNKVYVTALEVMNGELWLTQYNASLFLHQQKADNSWNSFAPYSTIGKFATDIVADFSGNLWIPNDPAQGGSLVVVDSRDGSVSYKADGNGSGGLPSKNIYSIALDQSGYIWVGTDQGIAYFYSAKSDAAKPIFENRFLLRDEKITAIEVDGGNRKWIGTERGVWLFDPLGETLIHNFTAENSPLLSNVIRDIEIHDETGEVFFATNKGIISYRADATAGSDKFGTVKIFPNPVPPGFSGAVGISGLAENAIVKITDISGKLIWETQANGGTATWNTRDYNGRKASTGIYLVFAATPDGSEHSVGKIAVVE